jgi:membrane-bound lytic murein transglycosylase D
VPAKEMRDRISAKYLQRYEIALKRFAQLGQRAVEYGPIEVRVFNVYSRSPSKLSTLYRGDIKLRIQTGLADEFLKAAERAQEYLPYMERVFTQAGLPVELTRLPFVESMFNLGARSKVGASGIWQFMPGTARTFDLNVGRVVDERNSPYKPTRGAARLMTSNFQRLRSWPLAITAYNHGPGGLERAIKNVGTDNLGTVIERYNSPSFGFASKNFYSEFLAAVTVYDRVSRGNRFQNSNRTNVLQETVVLKRPISLGQLMAQTALDRKTLEGLNPCLNSAAFGVHRYTPLPVPYEIRVPRQLARSVEIALNRIKPSTYATRN